MKTFAAATAVLAMLGTSALAGGPVVIAEEPAPVVVAQQSSSSAGWVLPVLALAVVAAVVASD